METLWQARLKRSAMGGGGGGRDRNSDLDRTLRPVAGAGAGASSLAQSMAQADALFGAADDGAAPLCSSAKAALDAPLLKPLVRTAGVAAAARARTLRPVRFALAVPSCIVFPLRFACVQHVSLPSSPAHAWVRTHARTTAAQTRSLGRVTMRDFRTSGLREGTVQDCGRAIVSVKRGVLGKARFRNVVDWMSGVGGELIALECTDASRSGSRSDSRGGSSAVAARSRGDVPAWLQKGGIRLQDPNARLEDPNANLMRLLEHVKAKAKALDVEVRGGDLGAEAAAPATAQAKRSKARQQLNQRTAIANLGTSAVARKALAPCIVGFPPPHLPCALARPHPTFSLWLARAQANRE